MASVVCPGTIGERPVSTVRRCVRATVRLRRARLCAALSGRCRTVLTLSGKRPKCEKPAQACSHRTGKRNHGICSHAVVTKGEQLQVLSAGAATAKNQV